MARIKSKSTWILITIIVILVGVAGVFAYKYIDSVQNDPQYQNAEVLGYIGKVVDLPSEQPTIATIIDTTKLSSLSLRTRALNGDKLLIYTSAKRLVLYRPATKKVIEILTIVDGQTTQQPGTDQTKMQ